MSSNDPVTREAFVSGLNNRQLHCRELGHTWRAWTVTYDRKAKAYDRRLRCSSCHSFRNELLDRSGDMLRYTYTYSAGYLAKRVEGRVHRSHFRLESLTRFLDKADSDPNLAAVS